LLGRVQQALAAGSANAGQVDELASLLSLISIHAPQASGCSYWWAIRT
jgi:hypothetical protein